MSLEIVPASPASLLALVRPTPDSGRLPDPPFSSQGGYAFMLPLLPPLRRHLPSRHPIFPVPFHPSRSPLAAAEPALRLSFCFSARPLALTH